MVRLCKNVLVSTILLMCWNVADYAAANGYLVVQWAGVVDNGEGDKWPHGPWGSLHILIYEANRFNGGCPGNWKSYPTPLRHIYLYGPWEGEWLDGDMYHKNALEIWKWRHANDRVLVFVYESDPGGVGRAHDPLLCVVVGRQETLYGIETIYGPWAAPDDAIINCQARNPGWVWQVWSGPYRGIPCMFLGIETVRQSGCTNDR